MAIRQIKVRLTDTTTGALLTKDVPYTITPEFSNDSDLGVLDPANLTDSEDTALRTTFSSGATVLPQPIAGTISGGTGTINIMESDDITGSVRYRFQAAHHEFTFEMPNVAADADVYLHELIPPGGGFSPSGGTVTLEARIDSRINLLVRALALAATTDTVAGDAIAALLDTAIGVSWRSGGGGPTSGITEAAARALIRSLVDSWARTDSSDLPPPAALGEDAATGRVLAIRTEAGALETYWTEAAGIRFYVGSAAPTGSVPDDPPDNSVYLETSSPPKLYLYDGASWTLSYTWAPAMTVVEAIGGVGSGARSISAEVLKAGAYAHPVNPDPVLGATVFPHRFYEGNGTTGRIFTPKTEHTVTANNRPPTGAGWESSWTEITDTGGGTTLAPMTTQEAIAGNVAAQRSISPSVLREGARAHPTTAAPSVGDQVHQGRIYLGHSASDRIFTPKTSHLVTAAGRPPDGADWEDHWHELTNTAALTTEEIQDIVGAMWSAEPFVDYHDATGKLDIDVEDFQDLAAAMWDAESAVTYNDTTGKLDITFPSPATTGNSWVLKFFRPGAAPSKIIAERLGHINQNGRFVPWTGIVTQYVGSGANDWTISVANAQDFSSLFAGDLRFAGGGGGVTDYDDLTDKPINRVSDEAAIPTAAASNLGHRYQTAAGALYRTVRTVIAGTDRIVNFDLFPTDTTSTSGVRFQGAVDNLSDVPLAVTVADEGKWWMVRHTIDRGENPFIVVDDQGSRQSIAHSPDTGHAYVGAWTDREVAKLSHEVTAAGQLVVAPDDSGAYQVYVVRAGFVAGTPDHDVYSHVRQDVTQHLLNRIDNLEVDDPTLTEVYTGDIVPTGSSRWVRVGTGTIPDTAEELVLDLGKPASTDTPSPSAHRHIVSLAQLRAWRAERGTNDPTAGGSVVQNQVPAILRDFVFRDTGNTAITGITARDVYVALGDGGELWMAFRDSARYAYGAAVHYGPRGAALP